VNFCMVYDIDIHQLNLEPFNLFFKLDEILLKICVLLHLCFMYI
jgi:hypothetical protein